MVGLIEPAERAVTQWFKEQGDAIILLGNTREDLGGTEYLKVLHHREQGSPPLLRFELERSVQACTIRLIRDGLVQSAHDCAEGGLAVALAECCISRSDEPVGAVVQLSVGGLRRDAVLFGESQSRIIVSVRPERLDRVMTLLRDAAVPAAMIGTVGGNRLVIRLEGNSPVSGGGIDLDLTTLHERWGQAIPRALGQH
jgi:phosphoribosylformylglycinamidine synthase